MFRRQHPWRMPATPDSQPSSSPSSSLGDSLPAPRREAQPQAGVEPQGIADYLIYGQPLEESQRHRLSGRVMAWQGSSESHSPNSQSHSSQSAWLWQMRDVADYWQSLATKAAGGAGVADYRPFLRQQFPDPDAPAVLSAQPFMGLLILAQMNERGLTGVVDSRDPFGQNLWRQARLPIFFELAAQVGLQWQREQQASARLPKAQTPKFHLPDFSRKLKRWQDFTAKASLRTVANLGALSYPGLRRRYGVFVAQLWQWLFGGNSDGLPFPWQSWRPNELPAVQRYLDYPVAAWQGMVPLLVEDLDRLRQQLPVSWRVVQLCWRVTFLHLETLTITVAFRHPHALHSEQPGYATAVQQAQYGYEALLRTLRERQDYLDLPQDLPAVSWQLQLQDYLEVHQRAVPLWADNHHHEQILAMENRLKVPLQRFQLTEDFLPEASFTSWSAATEPRSDCWLLAASERPLFIAKSPTPWPDGQPMQGRRFLERVEAKWWQLPLAQWHAARRDYFRAWDRRQQSYWVYRDGAGRWFCHGQYY